ncbi:virulence factor Mce-like protein [Actinophytocola algeriensis]|uniref:Virulence factor Mce-like protein n=2 Tax=Actinophytocola algeriensis TaxID=1768010 RepID=A0A7W7PZD4_9PSEU|nr:MCE family protein [Actinophytocola algeriensis]MBB4904135.1 virulence factor Mce-like protein [Actinophytocola algeriensis]MBE1477008.1 virulence factor Mce-like protein [Actinophytocola algeriensis]
MNARAMLGESRASRRAALVVIYALALMLLISAALWWITMERPGTRITAYFSKAVGVYPDSEVKVLGIGVGRITSVTPQGDRVRVEMSVADGIEIPATAQAVVVAPSLVSDRYVQLTPAYESGPLMADGTVIPLERTATPVELDDLTASVNDLTTALGPNGANSDGALSDVLDTAAANLSGNGELFNQTIQQLSAASAALADSSGDLFTTVDNLATFTEALAESDAQVRSFNDKLADVSGYLAEDRDELGTALTSLGTALTDVHGFIADNKDAISSNVGKLTGVTQALVDQRAAVAEILDVAPLAMSNFLNTYDAASASFAIRGNLNELTYPPVLMLCRTLRAGTPAELPKTISDICTQLAPYIDGTLGLPSLAEVLGALSAGELPPLPIPILDLSTAATGGGR